MSTADDDIEKTAKITIGAIVAIVIIALIIFVVAIVGGVMGLHKGLTTLGILAIVFAFVFPPAGFVLGIICLAKRGNY